MCKTFKFISNYREPLLKFLWPRLLYLATIKLTLSSQAAATADTCVLHVPEHTTGLAVSTYVMHDSSA